MNRLGMCLIITIVRKGWGDQVVEAARRAGAEGATITFARGVGVHENQKILGIPIEPEKEMILTIVPRDKADAILHEIEHDVELEKPGHGMAFVLPVDNVVGICHPSPEDTHQC